MNASIKKFVVAASLLAATCTFADSAEIVNVEGRGVGANKDEALKDAYRDAVERAVGMYVDAKQQMKNEELVEDQILTQSNAYIENCKVVKEKNKPNGLVEIRINADVKKTALTKKLRDVMPKQTFALGDDTQNIHSRVVTKEKRNVDAVALLENVLNEDLNPVKQLMKMTLADTKPIQKMVDRGYVANKGRERIFYRFRFTLDEAKYYGEFLPSLLKVLDQIALKSPKTVRLSAVPPEDQYLLDLKKQYIDGDWKSGLQDVREDGCLASGLAGYYTSDEGAYVGDVSLSDAKGKGWHVSCSNGNAYRNSRQAYEASEHDEPDRLSKGGVFRIFVIVKMNAARTVIQAREYEIPPECAAVVQKWQKRFLGKFNRDDAQTAYNIIFANDSGDEVAAASVQLKNRTLANVFLGKISHFSDRDSDFYGTTCWYVTPMIHCDAAALERWIGFDIPRDQLPNIKSVTVGLAE